MAKKGITKSLWMSFPLKSMEDMRVALAEWEAMCQDNSEITGTEIFEVLDKDSYSVSLQVET